MAGAAATFTACGSSSSGGGGDAGTDLGTGGDSTIDTGVRADSGHPGDSGIGQDTGTPPTDSGTPTDSGMPPLGASCSSDGGPPGATLLAAGNFILFGVTSDGFAIYQDPTFNIFAEAVAGGTPQMITMGTATSAIIIQGSGVLIWNTVVANPPQVSSLGVWHSGSGYKLLTSASIVGIAQVSPDGTKVVYSTNVNAGPTPPQGTVGDINGVNIDGTGDTPLVTSVDVNQRGACIATLQWAGSGATANAVVGYCASTADAGAGGTISTFSEAAWTKTDVLTNALPGGNGFPFLFNSDTAGASIYLPDIALNGVLVSLAGAGNKNVDTNVFGGQVFGDGTGVVYGTIAPTEGGVFGTMKYSPTGTPAPMALTGPTVNVAGFYTGTGLGLSPDSKWLYIFSTAAMTGFTDLQLISTNTAGNPTVLTTRANATLFTNGFTADSKYGLWYDNVGPAGSSTAGFGALHATNLSNGTSTALGAVTWNDFVVSGSKFTYNDNGMPNATNQLKGTADIEVIDISATTTPTKVIAQADVNYYTSGGGSQLVFTCSVSPNSQGLYAIATP